MANIEKEGIQNLYIIHCEGTDYYKIGVASYSEERLDSMQIGCPFKLILIAESPYYNKTLTQVKEKRLHQDLKSYHIRGEWYQLNPQILELILTQNKAVNSGAVIWNYVSWKGQWIISRLQSLSQEICQEEITTVSDK